MRHAAKHALLDIGKAHYWGAIVPVKTEVASVDRLSQKFVKGIIRTP